jgi:hypothetical protein
MTRSIALSALLLLSAATPGGSSRRLVHRFTLHLEAAADSVLPLFGPIAEKRWSPNWNPTMLYPDSGPVSEGAVFQTPAEEGATVWVMNVYDPKERRVEYTHVTGASMAAEIRVHVRHVSPHSSEADVMYRLTALDSAGVATLVAFSGRKAHMAAHWEMAINHYLRTGQALPHGELPAER